LKDCFCNLGIIVIGPDDIEEETPIRVLNLQGCESHFSNECECECDECCDNKHDHHTSHDITCAHTDCNTDTINLIRSLGIQIINC